MRKPLALLSILTLAACTGMGGPSAAPTVADPLVGKTLVAGTARFEFYADGTLGGNTGTGETIAGTYRADETEICSTLSAPETIAGDYCSVPVYEGNTVIFNRSNGTRSPLYSIEG